jgi:hypothetical protein
MPGLDWITDRAHVPQHKSPRPVNQALTLALASLTEVQPDRALVAATDDLHKPIAEALADATLVRVPEPLGTDALAGLPRFPAGLVAGVLGSLSHAEGLAFLGMLRNVLCRRVAVILDAPGISAGWSRDDLLALEFLPLGDSPADAASEAFVYDIDLYNRSRDWNNADHWANPQNFGRFRW